MKKKTALEKIIRLQEDNNAILKEILARISMTTSYEEQKITSTDTVVSETSEPYKTADIFNDDWPGAQ